MNIDELKDAWSKDDSGDMRLHLDTSKLNKTTSAVDRLKKNEDGVHYPTGMLCVHICCFIPECTFAAIF